MRQTLPVADVTAAPLMEGSGLRRSALGSLCLVFLLGLWTLNYQVPYLRYVTHRLLQSTTMARAPLEYSPYAGVAMCLPESVVAGIRLGDHFTEINGQTFEGYRTLDRELSKSRPGQTMTFRVRRVPASPDRARDPLIVVTLRPVRSNPLHLEQLITPILLLIFAPLLYLAVGFGLVLSRLRDRRAWIVLVLMISLSQQYRLEGWNGSRSVLQLVFQSVAPLCVGICLFLLAIYFPTRVSWDVRRPRLKWFLLAALGATALITAGYQVCAGLVALTSSSIYAWAEGAQTLCTVLNLCAVVLFVLGTARRIGQSDTPDLQRRMKLLLAGTLVSGTPLFLLTLVAIARGKGTMEVAPLWVVTPSLLLLGLFPCTLIAVMVAPRVSELRVMVRDAVFRASARRSSLVARLSLLLLFAGVLLFALYQPGLPRSDQRDLMLSVIAVAAGLEYMFAHGVPLWLDKRLFREQFRTARILASLCTTDCAMTDCFADSMMRPIANALRVSRVGLLLRGEVDFTLAESVGLIGSPMLALASGGATIEHVSATRLPALLYFDDPHSWTRALSTGERSVLETLDAELVVPLFGTKKLLGVMTLGRRLHDEPFSREHIDQLESIAGRASQGLEIRALATTLEEEITEREHSKGERLVMEEASKAKSTFIARMSHELRTPLNAIIGYSEMLQEEAEENGWPGLLADLGKICSAGKHLLSIINSILDISKIEAGKMELYIEAFPVQGVLNDVVDIARPLLTKNQNRLVCEFGPDLGVIEADLVKLRQVLFNLLSNAAKFTKQGTVTLGAERSASSAGDQIVFSIKDSGLGMTPERAAKLFEPFTQADASIARNFGGTGLGLAISRHFCQMMGGDITVASRPGEGSTFTVALPINRSPQPATDIGDGPSMFVTSEGRPRLLVIDDDPLVRDMLQRSFAGKGFQVAVAADGEEGLEKARTFHPDVITLDVLMEGMDGWSVLSRIKAVPELAGIKVVMLSIVDDKEKGFALGADEYLVKPIDRKLLMLALAGLSRTPGNTAGSGQLLVIDDDANNRQILGHMLRDEGWKVLEATSGKAGFAVLENAMPEMIFLDLVMPEMDGFTFLAELRSLPRYARIPVVVITAKTLTEPERRLLILKANHLVVRYGAELDTLLEDLKEHLERSLSKRVEEHA